MDRPSDNSDFRVPTVTIVGVGLIGGSIAAALKARGVCEQIIGVGRSEERLQAAQEAGLIDEGITSIEVAAAKSDLLIFCTPVDRIVDGVQQSAPHCRPGTVLTDAGSVKSAICERLANGLPEEVEFIGSHPLAGSEKNGFEHSEADLFEGSLCVVTPTEASSQDATAFISRFWQSIGMTVVEKSPAEHDRLLALTSHMPHVVAPALASLLDDDSVPFAASGFRDTTRIAGSDSELWTAIIEANAGSILESLDAFEASLRTFRESIATADWPRLQNLLQTAKTNRALLD